MCFFYFVLCYIFLINSNKQYVKFQYWLQLMIIKQKVFFKLCGRFSTKIITSYAA